MYTHYERQHPKDPVRESDYDRESLSIALSDQELLQKMMPKARNHIENAKVADARSESKSVKSKPKKNNRKPNKAAVESVQEEL